MHVIRVFLLVDKNALHHHSRGGVFLAEIANQLAIVLAGDALGDQIFPDHPDKIGTFDVLGSGASTSCRSPAEFGTDVKRAARPDITSGDLNWPGHRMELRFPAPIRS